MVVVVIREAGSSPFSSSEFKHHSIESSPSSNIIFLFLSFALSQKQHFKADVQGLIFLVPEKFNQLTVGLKVYILHVLFT